MDHIQRLSRAWVMFALLFVFSSNGWAQTPAIYWATGNLDLGPYTSAAATCAASPNSGPYETDPAFTWDHNELGPEYNPTCLSFYKRVASPFNIISYTRDSARRYNCGSGPFYDRPCDVPPNCVIGAPQPGVTWNIGYRTGPTAQSPLVKPIDIGAVANQAFCASQCLIIQDTGPTSKPGAAQTQGPATPGGYYPVVYTKDFITNGAQCTVSVVTPSPSAPPMPPTQVVTPPTVPSPGLDKCPAGTISGGIDSGGTPICIGNGTPSTQTKTETAPPVVVNNADGSTTTTTTTKTTNSDGSVTTNNTTVTTNRKNADGTPAPDQTDRGTQTGTNNQGLPGKSDGPADKPKDLCQQHPELNICKNSSVGGSCENTTCEGDAIECAALRVARVQACELHQATDQSKAGQAIIDGNDPMKGILPDPGKPTVVDLGVASQGFKSDGFLGGGGGSCLPDFSYNVLGRSGNFSFGPYCDKLAGIRLVVMLAALVIAYKMVGGTILRET